MSEITLNGFTVSICASDDGKINNRSWLVIISCFVISKTQRVIC